MMAAILRLRIAAGRRLVNPILNRARALRPLIQVQGAVGCGSGEKGSESGCQGHGRGVQAARPPSLESNYSTASAARRRFISLSAVTIPEGERATPAALSMRAVHVLHVLNR